MNLQELQNNQSPEEVAKILVDLFQKSDEDAMICAIFVKSQIPMYKGSLNPKWKFWDDVTKILYPNSNADTEQGFINELISLDNPKLVTP